MLVRAPMPGSAAVPAVAVRAVSIPAAEPALPEHAPAHSRTPGGAPAAPPAARLPIGTIAIPRIGLDVPLFEGVTPDVLARGPGHWPGTAPPGELGNSAIGGHRMTYSRPFRDLDLLARGDEVVITTDQRTIRYTITSTIVVRESDVWISDPTPTATLTLFTCHPKGSSRMRLVVRADLVGPGPLATPDPPPLLVPAPPPETTSPSPSPSPSPEPRLLPI